MIKNKILLHYIVSIFIFFIPYIIIAQNFYRLDHTNIIQELEEIIHLIYAPFIFCLGYSGTEYYNQLILSIIAHSCLFLMIISNIIFIYKQNLFTIIMLYFWNNVIFGFPNLVIFGFIILILG